MKEVLSLLGDLFEQKNFFAIFLFLIFISYVEDRGDFIYMASLDYRVSVLKEMSTLSTDPNMQNNPVLKKTYSNYLNEFSKRKALPMNTTESLYILLFKFLSGALLGLGYTVWALRSLKDKEDQKKILRGALAVSLFFGAIGTLLPLLPKIFSWNISTWQNLLINFAGLSVFQVLILLYIGGGKRKARQSEIGKAIASNRKTRPSKTRKLNLGEQKISNTK